MAPTVASFVLAGSGLLYAALGIVISVLARRNRPALALGIGLAAFGATFIVANLAPDAASLVTLNTIGYLVAAAGLATFAVWSGPSGASRRWGLVALALSAAAISAFAALFLPDTVVLTYFSREVLQTARIDQAAFAVLFVAIALLVLASALRARSADAHRARGFALLSVSLASYSALNGAGTIAQNALSTSLPTVLAFGLPLGLALAGAMTWAISAGPGRARLGRNVALVIGTFALLGASYPYWGFRTAIGIVRILGAGCVGVAVFKYDLLGVKLPRFAVSRGPVAAAALALLFIVAQIAQNFLAAQYGLLMGGIVAGAFLFAASPMQRAMESMREGRADQRAEPATTPHSREDEDAYCSALRIALRDRVVTPAEEVHLADLGERLGIRAGRARELRHAVESEIKEAR